ncbi:MAG: hypothetical protein AB7S26_08395 [Sandaracinaceae bacterium]
MRRSLQSAVAIVAALIGLMAGRDAAAQPDVLSAFEGHYAFAGGERERQRLREAIDSVVDHLDFFIREIARGEIHRAIRPEPDIRLHSVRGDAVRLSLGGWGPLDVQLDGRVRSVRGPDGNDTQLRATLRDGHIRLVQESSRGRRENVLSLSTDRRWLYLRVTVAADQLPEDIRYRLSYRRTDG